MNDDELALGLIMARENNYVHPDFDDLYQYPVLVYCSTIEREQCQFEITPRIEDLTSIGFSPVAVVRCNLDNFTFPIYSIATFSDAIRAAVEREAASFLHHALHDLLNLPEEEVEG